MGIGDYALYKSTFYLLAMINSDLLLVDFIKCVSFVSVL